GSKGWGQYDSADHPAVSRSGGKTGECKIQMKTPRLLVFLVSAVGLALGQTPVPAPQVCEKNVSFAVAEGGQPVPAIPKFVAKWVSDKKHQKESSGVCFSQIPDSLARNYVLVLSTEEFTLEGLTPIGHTSTRTTASPQNAMAISSHGGTWDYSYVGTGAAKTTATADLKLMDKAKSFFARLYNQHGEMLSRYSVGSSISRERMLESAVSDVRGDSQPPPKPKLFAAPLSVYYVNCDVDSETTRTAVQPSSESVPAASAELAKKEVAQESVLDFWSSPAGADILLDGGYVGETPSSLKVPPGEH